MKKVLFCLLMLISIKGFTQANYQFYKATIGAGLYFKAIPASASTLDSAVYVNRTNGEFQVRKVPASGVTDTTNKWLNDIRRRSGTDTVEKFKNGSWQFAYKDSIGGGGNGIYGGNGSLPSAVTITGAGNTLTMTGAQSSAAAFNVNNTGNGEAISATTTGTGSALSTNNSSTGPGATFSSNSGFAVNTTSTSGTLFRGRVDPSSTNTLLSTLRTIRGSTGTAAAGMGQTWNQDLEDDAGNPVNAVQYVAEWTSATGGSTSAEWQMWTVGSGTLVKRFTIKPTSQIQFHGYGTAAYSVTPAITPVFSSDGSMGTRVAPKIYTALLTATAGNDPTATVLGTNEIGSIVWTRNSAGNYTGTLTGAFTSNKTWAMIQAGDMGGNFVNGFISSTSANTITLVTLDNVNAAADSYSNISIEIRVYP